MASKVVGSEVRENELTPEIKRDLETLGELYRLDNKISPKMSWTMQKNANPFLVALSCVGVFAILFATKWGIGNCYDCSVYLGAAHSLLKGQGLSVPFGAAEPIPMNHYPPLYPALISAVGYFGLDPQSGARYIQALIMGANIFLVGKVIKTYTDNSFWVPIGGSFFILSSEDILRIHFLALSEPLFIFLGFLGLFLLTEYSHKKKTSLLIAASVAIALAALTRYVGVVLIVTGFIGILFLNHQTFRKRILDSIIFVAISSFPVILWLIRNYYAAGSGANRELTFHPFGFMHLKVALTTLSGWILPAWISSSTGGTVLLFIVIGLLLSSFTVLRPRAEPNVANKTDRPLTGILIFLGIFISVYLVILIMSVSFFDAFTYPDNRILSPVFVSAVILVFCYLEMSLKHSQRRQLLKAVWVPLAIILSGIYTFNAIRIIQSAHSDGVGYNRNIWRQSAIVDEIRTLPSGIPIYTNGPDAIYMLTGKNSILIPCRINPFSQQQNDACSAEVSAMMKHLSENDGIIIYFNRLKWRSYLVSESDLRTMLSLKPTKITYEGSIYKVMK